MDCKIAVVAIIVHENQVLLIKRNFSPINWCPPCGRVEKGETLEEGLKREVKEETGLSIKVGRNVYQWQGNHDGETIKSYTYICRANSFDVTLSKEHSDYRWIKIEDLENWKSFSDFELEKWSDWINE